MKFSQIDQTQQGDWMRKLLEILQMRRQGMFRFVEQFVRILLFGNGGGIAMIMGTVKLSSTGSEDPHWSSMITLVTFILGALLAAMAFIYVTQVSVKEAHEAEKAMYKFVNDEISSKEVLFFSEDRRMTYLVRMSSYCGLGSMIMLALGMLQGVIQVCIYF